MCTNSLIWSVSVSVRLAVIAADIIALAVSWKKAVGTVREAARFNLEVSISGVLIRDGECDLSSAHPMTVLMVL